VSIDIKALNALLGEVGPELQKANDSPAPSPDNFRTVGDDIVNPYNSGFSGMSRGDSLYLQRRLNSLSQEEKGYVLQKQLQEGAGKGVPLATWQAEHFGHVNPEVRKALDTTGGAALIRQDLDPIIISMFVQNFPAWQRINKTPANGVVHAWDQLTSYGDTDSSYISELGTVVDKTGVYERQTTNIAVYGQRRGVSFKQQLAVPAGGMSWDSARLEIQNGITQMAHDVQKTIFQGQASNSGGTASNELGLYDANSFNGLRSGLNNAYAVNFEPYLTSNPDNFVTGFNAAITAVTNNVGAVPSVAYLRYDELGRLSDQQLSIQRIVDTTEYVPGVRVPAIMTSAGTMPLVAVPGDAIGHYTTTSSDGPFSGGEDVADIYLVNESELTVVYLGQPGPSVIEIPPGVSGQLTRLYIVWGMFGLALMSNLHSIKLRANLATT
jgi:hypothetical protein